jgi:hypothetical protein
MKGHVVVDFIAGHSIEQNFNESCNLVSIHPWKLFFDGSTCRKGQGVRVVLISPRGAVFETSARLESFFCTNNQAVLLNLSQQNRMVQYQKPEGPK